MPKNLLNLLSRGLIAAGVVAITLAGFWIADKLLSYQLAESYVGKIADVFDLNVHLAEALTIALGFVLAGASGLVFSFDRKKRLLGISGIGGLLIINSIVLWFGTRSQYVDREGHALKCYFFNGDKVAYGEHSGKDPQTGRECRPITPDILWRLRQYETGRKPKIVVESDVIFFDQRSGDPLVWYARTRDQKIRLFDLMGFDPESGAELLAVTPEIAAEWRRQRADEKRAAAPVRQVDPAGIQFFNPRTGEPQVWYWRAADGHFEFFDSDGFHPVTGDKLLPVSKDVVLEWQKLRSELDRQDKEEEANRKRAEEDERSRAEQKKAELGEAERQKAEAEKRSQQTPQQQMKDLGIDLFRTLEGRFKQQLESSNGIPVQPNTNNGTGGTGHWEHNGSIMSLATDGNNGRTFVYDVPRDGLRAVGVVKGTVVFNGRKIGQSYQGTAYVFATNCQPAAYVVSGPVSDDQRSVTLRGKMPIQNARCAVLGYRDDELVFSYHD